MTENETVKLSIRLARNLPFWEDGDQLATIHVINHSEKDFDIPFPERQPQGNAWIETDPVCTDYICRRTEVEFFVKFFTDKGCHIGSIKYFEYKKFVWYSHWDFQGAKDALLELVKNPEQKSAECRLVYRQYEINDKKGTINLTNTQNIFRFCDAYYGFKNVKTLKTVFANYDPSTFTKDNPLILNPFINLLVVSENVLEPVAYTGIMYITEIRKELKPTMGF